MYHQEVAIIYVAILIFAAFLFLCGRMIKQKKTGTLTKQTIYDGITGGVIVISFLLWYFNFGMLRYLFAIPMLIHGAVLFFLVHITSGYGAENKKIYGVIHGVLLTFVLLHLFLPDTDFTSVSALCCLIENQAMIIGCFVMALISMLAHWVFLIVMLVLRTKEKKK